MYHPMNFFENFSHTLIVFFNMLMCIPLAMASVAISSNSWDVILNIYFVVWMVYSFLIIFSGFGIKKSGYSSVACHNVSDS